MHCVCQTFLTKNSELFGISRTLRIAVIGRSYFALIRHDNRHNNVCDKAREKRRYKRYKGKQQSYQSLVDIEIVGNSGAYASNHLVAAFLVKFFSC